MIAPNERYTPPLIGLSCCLIESTSIRKFFFSDRFKFDLSIALISFNLSNKPLAFIDSAFFETTKELQQLMKRLIETGKMIITSYLLSLSKEHFFSYVH